MGSDLVMIETNLTCTRDMVRDSLEYTDEYVTYLTKLAISHAVPTAYHDKRALSPTKQTELLQAAVLSRGQNNLVPCGSKTS